MDDRSKFISFFTNAIKERLDLLKTNFENEDTDGFALHEYEELKKSLTPEEKEMVYSITYDILESYTHSIMTMLDNGTELSDDFLIDIINYDTEESLTEDYDSSLDDDFTEAMLEAFDD